MLIFISQPMKGKTNEQIKQEREELIQELEKQGHEVIDSVISDKVPENCDEAMYFLGKSIELMSKADGVVFMEGWEAARGCRVEYDVASNYGKFIKEV